jgi:hypothetical protein
MRLLITGSRGWHDEGAIEAVIAHYKQQSRVLREEFVLIHGHAKSGADALADRVGQRLGLKVGKDLIRVPADWRRYGKGAGPKRNTRMLEEFHPDVVVAFRATGKSNGTDDMITQAKAAEVPTHVLTERTHVTHPRVTH